LQTSDLELVRTAAGGDSSAFHALVDRHAKDLFRLALSLSRCRSDAEDIVQETLTGAFQGLKGFGGRSSVKTWLTRILIRRAAKHWHRSKRLRLAVPLDMAQHDEGGANGRLTSASGTAGVDHKIDLAAVLQHLSPPHREVIVLRELQGMTYEEIAQSLGIPRGTVESRLHRARLDLQQRLKGYFS
jgi:RNA polymerase sigma-70 factor (ECF subfamily)